MNKINQPVGGMVFCPGCAEMLTREDLEDYAECPYCSHEFEFDDELEDFLLQPVVEQWLTYQRYE